MNPETRYGAIAGIGVSLWITTEFLLGLHTTRTSIGQYTGILSILVPATAIYYAFRRIKPGNFWSGLKTGFTISAVAALIITAFMALYNSYMNPGWLENAVELQKKTMIESGISPEKAEAGSSEMLKLYKEPIRSISIFLGVIIQGMILAAITYWATKPRAKAI
ncbi:DUF4199 domain-containing protein [Candidatus Woesearchaeota archaeon]|nr:DUF4199 domain-containing protein [Candidatus Woesearchaeota archaeon]